MDKATVRELKAADLSGLSVLLRADLNTPLEGQRVADDARIRQTLPTVRLLRDAGARIVAISHMGRPGGRREARYSLRPVIERLRELLGGGVRFHDGLVGPRARAAAQQLGPGEVLALENTRFDPRETRNDASLASALAELGEIFVNDAFGGRAPGARLHGRGGRAGAGARGTGGRRNPDGEGAGLLGTHCGRARATLRRDIGRGQDLGQDRRDPEPPVPSRPPPRRRRDGQYVLLRARARHRPVARGARPGGDGPHVPGSRWRATPSARGLCGG